MKTKETLDFKLDKIDYRLKETLPNVIIFAAALVCYCLICLFATFMAALITCALMIFLVIFLRKKERKEYYELFNKHFKVNIINKK